MTTQFYRQFHEWLQQDAVVLATVTAVTGSVPREVGAKMLLRSGGEAFGTIGGGAGEAKVIQAAAQILHTGKKQQIVIDLTGAAHRATEGVCGGQMQVWLERWSGESAIALVQQILQALSSHQCVDLVTPLTATAMPYLQPVQAGEQVASGTVRMTAKVTALPQNPPVDALVERIQPQPTLLIVGAGHVGMALAQVAHLAGFQLIVQDDRPDWACAARFPEGTTVWSSAIAPMLQSFSLPPHSYIALVTRGYTHDLAALQAIAKFVPLPRYVGMIGSRKRVRLVLQAFRQWVSQSDGVEVSWIEQIHAPIGLDIGALTPAEIAVSIVAELIQVRRGGTGRSLSY